jgi:DNA polymerase-3 subunit gamma/tau
MVYYRTYRPMRIEELDSPRLRERLYGAFASGTFPHALLFTGPKGLGKTSTARIIAKIVNCERNAFSNISTRTLPLSHDEIEPCNQCNQCLSIIKGANMDVLEIDGASNRGIDEIRALRESVHLSASASRIKVYIIDEVHMLTTEAFNALLKTIEEPPAHVMFIFCTTEPHKVPDTIRSRCVHISLQKATNEEIVSALKRIVEGEKLTVHSDALSRIAELASGGFRDAVKLLDEVAQARSDPSATIDVLLVEKVRSVTGIDDISSVFVDAAIRQDMKALRDGIDKAEQEGIDVRSVYEAVMRGMHQRLRDAVLRSDEQTIQTCTVLLDNLLREFAFVSTSPLPFLPLELALTAADTLPAEETQQLPSRSPHRTSAVTINTLVKKQHSMRVAALVNKPPKETPASQAPSGQQRDITTSAELMEHMMYVIKKHNHTLAGVLRGCEIASMTDEQVVIQTKFSFHKERLEQHEAIDQITSAIRSITGKDMKVVVQLITT